MFFWRRERTNKLQKLSKRQFHDGQNISHYFRFLLSNSDSFPVLNSDWFPDVAANTADNAADNSTNIKPGRYGIGDGVGPVELVVAKHMILAK